MRYTLNYQMRPGDIHLDALFPLAVRESPRYVSAPFEYECTLVVVSPDSPMEIECRERFRVERGYGWEHASEACRIRSDGRYWGILIGSRLIDQLVAATFGEPGLSGFLDELAGSGHTMCDEESLGEIPRICSNLAGELEAREPAFRTNARFMLISLLTELYRAGLATTKYDLDSYRLPTIIDFIEKRYADELSVANLARRIGYSSSYFSRIFSRTVGIPVSEYINRTRIRAACLLLKRSNRTITEISVEIGTMRLLDLPAILDGEALVVPEDSPLILAAGGVDVAVLERSGSLLDLPSHLNVDEWHRGAFVDEIQQRENQGSAPIEKPVALAMEEFGDELREIRSTLSQLAQYSGGDKQLYSEDENLGFGPEQARDVSIALGAETEQIAAFLLAPLDPEFAVGVLASLPETMQPGVVERIINLGDASKSLHRRMASAISRRAVSTHRQRIAGGAPAVARILNHTPQSVEKRVMTLFKESNEPLFESIASRLFVFEDFTLVDALAIRKLATRVDPEEIALALH